MLNSDTKSGETETAGRSRFLAEIPLTVWLAVIIVAGVAALYCYVMTPKTPGEYVKRATSRMQRAQFRGAVDDFNAALELLQGDCADDPYKWLYQRSCHSGLGVSHFMLGNYEEAIHYSSKSLEAAPDDADSYRIRALAYGNLGDWRKSLDDWERRLELLPDDTFTIARRAQVRCELKDYAGALADYHTLLRLRPSEIKWVYGIGYIHFRAGEYSKAISYFDRAIHCNPRYAKAYHLRSIAHYRMGNEEQAKQDFQEAVSIDPSWKDKPYTAKDDEMMGPIRWEPKAW